MAFTIKPVFLALFITSTVLVRSSFSSSSILFLILSQPTEYFEIRSQHLRESIKQQAELLDVQVDIYRSHVEFADIIGAWAVWPLLPHVVKVAKNKPFQWLFVCEDETTINLDRLLKVLNKFDHQQELFLGHGLNDREATIIHHYAFAGENPSQFLYPDFAAGFGISWSLAKRLVNKINDDFEKPNFAIDPKHELAMLIRDNGNGPHLIDVPEFCTTKHEESCATEFKAEYLSCNQYPISIDEDLLIAVKTFHKHHKTRIVVVKRTWAKESENIQYYSDVDDKFVPTINLGLDNTERGHCGKTMGIIKKFALSDEREHQWLAIVDDDTILSVQRLSRLLSCFNKNETIIIGERYGYGFNPNGFRGYDYPTGGSGMIFSPEAASNIAFHCRCPSPDSPDDMILGMCAQNLHIPIIHSAALHQARPVDYAEDYIARLKPVSFHKHWEIDPYAVYFDYLHEPGNETSHKEGDVEDGGHGHMSDEL